VFPTGRQASAKAHAFTIFMEWTFRRKLANRRACRFNYSPIEARPSRPAEIAALPQFDQLLGRQVDDLLQCVKLGPVLPELVATMLGR